MERIIIRKLKRSDFADYKNDGKRLICNINYDVKPMVVRRICFQDRKI